MYILRFEKIVHSFAILAEKIEKLDFIQRNALRVAFLENAVHVQFVFDLLVENVVFKVIIQIFVDVFWDVFNEVQNDDHPMSFKTC